MRNSNTTGATCRAGTANPSGAHEFTLGWVRVARFLIFCGMFSRSLFVLFRLVVVLFVLLRYTASDYFFGIFKFFLFHA